ncbi:MAG: FABP family protein [Pseudolysinimonas sp.]|uniref:FABP family protein n=1 Tax=Pseudolysinimonas sp. TaxID=2680009 RepID=UPI003C769437
MFDIDASLPAEVIPLSWLLGVWEGTGVLAYRHGEDVREHEFGQRVAFTQDGGPHVQYACSTWLLGDDAHGILFSEIGYWRLSRPLGTADPGPGMLPGVGDPVFTTSEAVETLRNAAGSFDVEVSILQPGGVSELYLGTVDGPRIDLGTDAVVRSATAKEYAAATRLYGLVDDHLLWAWDIAALGQDLRTHASGRLARVD